MVAIREKRFSTGLEMEITLIQNESQSWQIVSTIFIDEQIFKSMFTHNGFARIRQNLNFFYESGAEIHG